MMFKISLSFILTSDYTSDDNNAEFEPEGERYSFVSDTHYVRCWNSGVVSLEHTHSGKQAAGQCCAYIVKYASTV